jgi:hypothetical protein
MSTRNGARRRQRNANAHRPSDFLILFNPRRCTCSPIRQTQASPTSRNDSVHRQRYTSFTFLSGRLRIGLPVAAKMALSTAGATTQMVGSPTPPQKS